MITNRYRNRDIVTLGVKAEIIPYDFTVMGWDVSVMLEKLHDIAYAALMDRDIVTIYPWTGYTLGAFKRNGITKIGQICNMTESKVFSLHGCGLVIRKEVYGVFQEVIGITLPAWNPKRWYQKYRNYDFGDEE